MSTSLSCPHCQAKLRVKAPPRPSQSFRCPKCSQAFNVPDEDDEPIAVPLSPAGFDKRWLFAVAGFVLVVLLGIGVWLIFGGSSRNPNNQIAEKKKEPLPEPVPEKTEKPPEPIKDTSAKDTPGKDAPKSTHEDDAKQREEYLKYMIDGGTAFNAKDYLAALIAYQTALKVMPKDEAAAKKASEAQSALDLAAKSKTESTLAELTKLKEQGQKALDDMQYAAAADLFQQLLDKRPGDADATKLLATARAELEKDQAEKKKGADFKKHLDAGKAALAAGRYPDAIGEFVAAQLILPNNAEALQLQQQAENKIAAAQKKENRSDFDKVIDQAAAAMRAAKFDEAAALFQKALKIIPKDKEAVKGLDDAQKAMNNLAAEYDTYMKRGAKAMADGRLRDAVDAYREAKRLFPANEAASKALRQAEAAKENQATYFQAMKRGAFSMQRELYSEAVAAFTEALNAVPNDLNARAALIEAQKGLEVEVRKKKEFDFKLQTGLLAAKQMRYAEAAKAYNEAVKLFPNHPQAAGIARQARYNDAMAEGTNAMNAKQFPDAVRAFQRALMEVPNDFAANAALTRARVLAGGKVK